MFLIIVKFKIVVEKFFKVFFNSFLLFLIIVKCKIVVEKFFKVFFNSFLKIQNMLIILALRIARKKLLG